MRLDGLSSEAGDCTVVLTSGHLANCCIKHARFSDCWLGKVTKIVGHSDPNDDVGRVVLAIVWYDKNFI